MHENGDLVRDLYVALARLDVAAFLGALDPGIEWREAEGFVYGDGNPYVGPQAVLQAFLRRRSEVEDIVVLPEHFVEGRDTIVVEGRYRGRIKATGKLIDAQFAHVWQMWQGKVVRFQQYTDTRQWADAARLTKTAAERAD